MCLHFGVLQGSISKPKYYCTYTKPIIERIKQQNIKYSDVLKSHNCFVLLSKIPDICVISLNQIFNNKC